ncbi:(d)CMP kinase [Caenibacillus caldisaponilyticus]|uniref:(d)CMP kinase n=1 Tax=Caenibacillus caldisaponilyticus TaxID=1674942 RepID=UPI00098836BF|nr:(d)CMP kinase [Caenibacillus caldisaponilyticus]
MGLQIAIDGPAAAGKSTIAKKIADHLNYVYIDTGAMYRAATYKALQKGIDLNDGKALANMLKETSIELLPGKNGQIVKLDGADVTEIIRSPLVSNNVSFVSRHPELREVMVERQRALADKGGVVMDGRDIGTRVLPHADVKIFMVASVEKRAERRYKEQLKKGIDTPLDELKREIMLRDERDRRQLGKADDAIEIDTTSLSIDEVVERIMAIIKERAANGEAL